MSNLNFQIIQYIDKYKEDANNLLIRLQEHIVKIDPERVQKLNTDYKNEYLNYVISKVNSNNGVIYLATHNQITVGMIAGYIEPKDKEDRLTNTCPIRGIVSELFICETYRHKGIAKSLFATIEEYFQSYGCEFVAVNVFAPNVSTFDFYKSLGYAERNIEMYKKLKQL